MSAIVLISTTDRREGRPEVLRRLIESIEGEITQRSGMRCTLHLLLQNCTDEELERLRPSLPSFVSPLAVPTRISLSAARNILLRSRGVSAAEPFDIVGFPDDDCWYPPGALAFVADQFAADSDLDFWFCRYASNPEPFAESPSQGATAGLVVQHASSNTMFVRRLILDRVGRFDEDLGVGTPNSGGEDLAFALGSYLSSRKARFCDRAGIGHRDKISEFGVRYYPGSLLALARHARAHKSVFAQYVRKIAVGIYLVLKGTLSAGQFLRANCAALRGLGGSGRRGSTAA
jgi:hypothetical protein